MNNSIKIFIADDHPIVRDGLISILETQEDFVIVGQAGNGGEAISKIKNTAADVLICDLEMPQKDGLEVIQDLQKIKPELPIIVFTVYDTDERIVSAIQSGAKGYLLKGASHQEIFHAIREAHKGGSILQPIVATKFIQKMNQQEDALSQREKEVLQEIANGKKNKEIGQVLFISERTVKFHISSILSKLNANNRTDAVQIAIKQGIITI